MAVCTVPVYIQYIYTYMYIYICIYVYVYIVYIYTVYILELYIHTHTHAWDETHGLVFAGGKYPTTVLEPQLSSRIHIPNRI